MQQMDLKKEDRPVVMPALAKREACGGAPAAAIRLPDGRVITGKATRLLSACSGAMLNAIKVLADIPKSVLLMSPQVLEPVVKLKLDLLKSQSSVLKLDDVLTALYICAASDATAAAAVEQLPQLRGCELHSTQLLHSGDESTLRKMAINVTCEPEFPDKSLYFT